MAVQKLWCQVVKSFYLDLFNICNSHYAVHTHTSDRMKSKIFYMDRELILEAKSLIQNIRHYRHHYQGMPVFQLAETVYELRQQYARMIIVYKKCCKLIFADKNINRPMLDFLMEIQQIHMHIDKLVEQMIEWEHNRLKTERIKIRKLKSKSKRNSTNSTEGVQVDKLLRTVITDAERDIQRQKQKSYLERKKLAWAMSMGMDRKAAKNILQRKKELAEEGFDSDVN